MIFSKKERNITALLAAVSVLFAWQAQAGAMHIMEGYLQPSWVVVWSVLCIPFIAAGFFSIKRNISGSHKKLVLFALCGAFAFVLSALKIPSVSGSCSHPTGVGLSAILFGPFATSVIGLIILVFQALLLGHGGITTLGANTFSMAIAGPLVSFGIYKLCKKMKINLSVAVFLAAFLGDLITYITTSFQMGMAHPGTSLMESVIKFLGIFAVTQLPLAVVEGILTVVIFGVIKKYRKPELEELRVL